MRLVLSLALLACLATGGALADSRTQMKACTNRWGTMSAVERGRMGRNEYLAQCLKTGPATAAKTTIKPGWGGVMPARRRGNGQGR